jgi:hypothetical protein
MNDDNCIFNIEYNEKTTFQDIINKLKKDWFKDI